MGIKDRLGNKRQSDDFWVSDVQDAGRAPVVAGLVIAVLLVAVVALWQFFSGSFAADVTVEKSDQSSESVESADAESLTGLVYVHVVGAVNAPGVYALNAQARVYDAIAAAGGVSEDADADALNLARVVTDGEQIRVPAIGESQDDSGTANSSGQSTDNMIVNGKVNINAADSETLQTLSGVGESTAAKIIEDRDANGPFATIEDIKRVSGIGDKKFAALADYICVG